MPKVSICIPNLNNRPYLPERFETIFNQTFQDWELIVCDNHSEDGAWEFFQEQAARDKRIRISQAPREGLYANWNNCIRQARGEHVYIATSDDTMTSDCLERLVCALQSYPSAAVASSMPWVIDELGQEIEIHREGDIERSLAQTSVDPQLMDMQELAYAGLWRDRTPALSMTQLLFRRSVFDAVGLFPTQFGSAGDWAWQMKAVGMTKWAFVPEKLGSWRRHATQATLLTADSDEIHALESRMGHWLVEQRAYDWNWRLKFTLGRFIAERSRRAPFTDAICFSGFIMQKARQYLKSRA